MPEIDGRRLAATMVVLFVAALLLLLFARISEILVLLFMAALLSVYLSAATDAVVRRFHIPRSLALTLAMNIARSNPSKVALEQQHRMS